MRLSRFIRFKKSRKYPIQRDQEGKSLRTRCFERFSQGERPKQVAEELNVKESTVRRYFRDWQNLTPDFPKQYAYIKELLKKTNPERAKNLELVAHTLGISQAELETTLSKPHGLKQLLTHQLYFPAHSEADHKRHIALELGILIADHLINKGGKYEDVYSALEQWMQQHQAYREEEDEDIERENQFISIVKKIIQVDLENERKGQVQPEHLSEKERERIRKWVVQANLKDFERMYWIMISQMMTEGLTNEEAREKMVQDLLSQGKIQGAEALRQYQNVIHPLKKDNSNPPSTSNPSAI